ncbi:colicin V production protein [Pseudoxanthomonas broegbernensis]|uniref:Colicin V production protein n=1 Tax=Pseudoxanthomonas broegbernensis TaxID=83619 RepID=A0A7V8K6M3_9GAMM|nr:CvpA family protein [Pseudoxanthomonas broegbernensis]KAF1685460.1 colicin V production protein [Pseudoxanthomonas broegbernensis]MBB6064409.1 membrane protein required for colicin V production [Pseudoxanthomonas broegbernensis]
MNAIDLLLLAVVAASALLGLMRGFVGTVASVVAWLGAGWVAFRHGAELAFWFSDDGQPGATELLGGYVVSFLAVMILAGVVGWIMRKLLASVGLSGVDRALGLFLGLARGGLVACMLVLLMAFSRLPQEPAWGQSRAVPVLVPGAQWLARWLPAWALDELDFGNGRASGDNSLLERDALGRAAAAARSVAEALPAPMDGDPAPPGAAPPPSPSNPGH